MNMTAIKTMIENAPETNGWPEPLSLLASTKPEPYPLDALPCKIRDAVQETVGFAQYPVALAACSALSVLSLAGQALADVRRDEKLDGATSLYFLVIAESGERKTSADNFYMTAVYDFDKRMREENKEPLAKYRADLEIFDATRQGLKARLAAAKKKGNSDIGAENELRSLEVKAPKPPLFPQIVYSDATPEALGIGLAEKWPSAGVISAEAGIVFGSHGMGKDSVMRNLALLNTLWDGKTFKVDRTVAKSYILEGARLSMGLAVQAGTVRAFFENCKGLARDTGFAARFLIAWPESTQGTRFYIEPPTGWPCLAAFHRRIDAMLSQTPQIEGNGLVLPMLELSPEAKAKWIKFHDDVERELAPNGEMTETRDVASKAADNVARLAALFHLFEQGSPTGQIGAEHIASAATIVSWHLYEARRFLGEVAVPSHADDAIKLDAWLVSWCLQNGKTEVTTTEVLQRGPNAIRRKHALDAALHMLTQLYRVKILQSGNSRRIVINPALLTGGSHGSA